MNTYNEYVLCNTCQKNPATIHYPAYLGGHGLVDVHLCHECNTSGDLTGNMTRRSLAAALSTEYNARVAESVGETRENHSDPAEQVDLESTPQLKRMRLTLELQSRQDIVSIIEDAIYEFVSDNCPHCNASHNAHDYIADDDIHSWLKKRLK